MHYPFTNLLVVLFCCISFFGCAEKGTDGKQTSTSSSEEVIVQPLAVTDELGRILPLNESVGNPKPNRQVGIFYFLWQGDKSSPTSEKYWDLTEIVPNHPEVLEDVAHPQWGTTNYGGYYFWGKSIYGYYRGDDYWVHLRNMQLLADAQVDFLVLDATNTLIYPEQSEALMQAIEDMAGIRTDASGYGYKVIRFEPLFMDWMDWAKATVESPYGSIVSDWKHVEDEVEWNLEIPANSSGIVALPNGKKLSVNGGPLDENTFTVAEKEDSKNLLSFSIRQLSNSGK